MIGLSSPSTPVGDCWHRTIPTPGRPPVVVALEAVSFRAYSKPRCQAISLLSIKQRIVDIKRSRCRLHSLHSPCTGYVVDGFRKPPVLGGYLSHEQERGSIEGMVISSIKKVNRTLEDSLIKVALTFY